MKRSKRRRITFALISAGVVAAALGLFPLKTAALSYYAPQPAYGAMFPAPFFRAPVVVGQMPHPTLIAQQQMMMQQMRLQQQVAVAQALHWGGSQQLGASYMPGIGMSAINNQATFNRLSVSGFFTSPVLY